MSRNNQRGTRNNRGNAMNAIIIVLAVVLAVLLGILGYFMFKEKSETKKEPTEGSEILTEKVTEPTEATEATELTEAPTQTDEPETEATERTEPPAPETEATEATEAPTETTPPVDVDATNSGQFTSNTGTALELVVDWKTYTSSDGTKMVRFDVSISCLGIHVGSRLDGLHITVDGVTKSFDCEGADADGGRNTFPLGSYAMEMSGDSADVSVAWDFRGTYSGVQMEQVTATGTVTR